MVHEGGVLGVVEKRERKCLDFCVSTHGKFDLEFKNFSKLGIFTE